MTAYAVALLRQVTVTSEVVEYLQRIGDTLQPFGGRYVVHGGKPDVLEGTFDGALVVIEFPDREHALGWYRSAPYQEILPLRTANSVADTFIVDGVSENYRATSILVG